MALPGTVREIMKVSARLKLEREAPLHVEIVVDPDADDALIEAVRERFTPATSGVRLGIEVCTPETPWAFVASTDVVVAVYGSRWAEVGAALAAARRVGVPAVLITLDPQRDEVARLTGHVATDTLSNAEPSALIAEDLARWLVERLDSKRLALAHNFPFIRAAVAREAVRATAAQNALIGAVVFVPGADMPLMTANQAKMLLQIAAAYGQPLGVERVRELLVVAGAGFALRVVARQVLGVVPGFGWAAKGAIAYAGTLAMGSAAITYFEQGADLSRVVNKAVAAREAAAMRAKRTDAGV